MHTQDLLLDPDLKWPLFGITIVMIFIGLLRHYLTVMMQDTPKKSDAQAAREQAHLFKATQLRSHASQIPEPAFLARKSYLSRGIKEGIFLKDPESRGKPPPNPLTDPGGMDQMMGMMKSNMATFVPQTLIMSWINFFFTGFILMKLPFPLTIRFKSMLQSGVATKDLDVRWVSSLSWYFMNLFGLRPVYALILGNDNTAGDTYAMQGMPNPQAMPSLGPGQDVSKMFDTEAENLELIVHDFVLDGIEERALN